MLQIHPFFAIPITPKSHKPYLPSRLRDRRHQHFQLHKHRQSTAHSPPYLHITPCNIRFPAHANPLPIPQTFCHKSHRTPYIKKQSAVLQRTAAIFIIGYDSIGSTNYHKGLAHHLSTKPKNSELILCNCIIKAGDIRIISFIFSSDIFIINVISV